MTARPKDDTAKAEKQLDRLLAAAPTPRVPDDLARRIIQDVTRLPQQPLIRKETSAGEVEDAPAPKSHAGRRAALGALLLAAAGLAGFALLGSGDDRTQPAAQLTADLSGPTAGAPEPAPAAPAAKLATAGPSRSGPAPQQQSAAKAIHPAPHSGKDAPSSTLPAAEPREPEAELAQATDDTSTPVETGAADELTAQNSTPVQASPSPSSAPSSAPVYGPPASQQGFGLMGNGIGQSSPTGSAPRGGPPPGPHPPPR